MANAFPIVLSSLSFHTQEQAKNLVFHPIQPTNYVLSSLKSCSTVREFSAIHAHLITTNLIRDPLVASHVLWFFVSREKNSHFARSVFSQNPEPEVTVWNTLLKNHLKERNMDGVFLTYSHMVAQGVSLDKSTFHFLIHACSKSLELRRGIEVHGRVIKSGMARNKSLNNNLMGFYSKFGKLAEARELFDKMSHRDVITWNTMISCHVHMGMYREALDLFSEIPGNGVVADEVTMVSLLSACSKLGDLEMGEKLHGFIEENRLKISGNLLNCLVNMYTECGKMEKAHELAEKYETTDSDVVLWTSVVRGYVRAKNILAARLVFDRIKEKNLITWTVMISGYFQSGQYRETLELFSEMRVRNIIPDKILVVSVLSACTNWGDLRFGRSIHSLIAKCGMVVEGPLGNSLLHLYSKLAEPKMARLIFDTLPEKTVSSWNSMLDGLCRSGDIKIAKSFFEEIPNKDVVSWNTILNTLVKSRRFGEAFETFRSMPVKPDNLTLVTLLSCCASVGALSNGIWAHAYAERNGIAIDEKLGTSLIDMYGKCGCVEKAREVFSTMAEKNKNVFAWTAMIAAHAMEGQAHRAIDLFSEMKRSGIKPDRVTFIALLSACSHGGLVDKGLEYFNTMHIAPEIQHYSCVVDLLSRAGRLHEALEFIEKMPIEPNVSIWSSFLRSCEIRGDVGLAEKALQRIVEIDPRSVSGRARTRPGRSVVEQDGFVHEFTASDFSNPRSPRIHALLAEMKGKFKELRLEEASEHHSERLAVAFCLINATTAPIQVVNNLRICRDCHSAMKVMSKVYNREIVIRDNYRFHRFVDGNCTCKEHW